MFDYFTAVTVAVPLSLFLGILACLEVGRRIGVRRAATNREATTSSTATVDAAVFGLMGLLLAFTFSGAMQRWDARRDLVVQETNAIGTAWLRIDSLPADAQPALRELFRRYLDARLGVYRSLPDVDAARAELALSSDLQGEIWTYSMAKCLDPSAEKARLLLLPALNEMIDITTNRTMAMLTHPPMVIYVLLFALVLASSLVAGFAMSAAPTRSWMHMLCFAAAMSVGLYVILDLEFPRAGLIRINAVDQILVDLRATMD